jgi:hypothetical protein
MAHIHVNLCLNCTNSTKLQLLLTILQINRAEKDFGTESCDIYMFYTYVSQIQCSEASIHVPNSVL